MHDKTPAPIVLIEVATLSYFPRPTRKRSMRVSGRIRAGLFSVYLHVGQPKAIHFFAFNDDVQDAASWRWVTGVGIIVRALGISSSANCQARVSSRMENEDFRRMMSSGELDVTSRHHGTLFQIIRTRQQVSSISLAVRSKRRVSVDSSREV